LVLGLNSKGHPLPSSAVSERFPAAAYADAVLAVNFEDAKKYFLDALLEIHAAHTLMLARQNIMPSADAARILDALASFDRTEIRTESYDGSFEDLFFYVQNRLVLICGEDVAGKMHTARSRNDIDLTMYRMCLRREILRLTSETSAVRRVLLDLASANVETIIPAYTHTQPAQPTTLAHYLLAAVEFLGRDEVRLRSAFATINRNPLGSCAITTTGFPIDRQFTSELLGFEALQTNSYGAIGAIDYVTESAGVIAVLMINLGKLVQDLLLWCTEEFGFLRLSDAYVQGSSIMPQKRNPVALEHCRILASKALGQAQAVLTCVHNTPFGDIVDSEDDLQPLIFSMSTDASRALKLFENLMRGANFNYDRLRLRAAASFLTVTELADTLVREEKISFVTAHHLVAAAVRAAGQDQSPGRLVEELEKNASRFIGRDLRTPRDVCIRALDPAHFVVSRKILGGPAPEVVRDQIATAQQELSVTLKWIESKRALFMRYPVLIQESIDSLERASR